MDSIARPTSKVLAPPGGVSSNIFGTDPEPIKGNFAKILRKLWYNIVYYFKNSIQKILVIKPMIFLEHEMKERLKKQKIEKMKRPLPNKQNKNQQL